MIQVIWKLSIEIKRLKNYEIIRQTDIN